MRGMMNYRIVCDLLGMVAIIFGGCMFLCLPWALPAFGGGETEHRGAVGLLISGVFSFALGLVFSFFGRGADETRLFRKEAIIIVALSWLLATFLGALPYLFSGTERAPGVPASFCDALFESASGLTTTGATVFSELEDPVSLPRTILFWRCMTHFLGGLGVMCFFVTLLGQGANGKAILKLERTVSGAVPASKIRTLAFYLFLIYAFLTFVCFILLKLCGMTVFDAISHSFSVIALGGFSTRNMSVAYYSLDPMVNGFAVECVLLFFMVVAGTNFWLIYWALTGQPKRLFRDAEWRLFVVLLSIGVFTVAIFGHFRGDFQGANSPSSPAFSNAALAQPSDASSGVESVSDLNSDVLSETNRSPETDWSGFGTSLRHSAFQVISVATGAGFATDRFELWNSVSLAIVIFLMFVGASSGSTGGGAKVFRILLVAKAFKQNLARSFSPNVVRVTRVDGENIDKDALHSAVSYVLLFFTLVFLTGLLAIAIEPDAVWIARGESQIEKACDLMVGSLSMYSNCGPALGAMGAFDNYGSLSEVTKFIFSVATLLGRLEILTILALFSPNFWRNR